jgi:myo-inositol-1(or 4)-monophosphatase
MLFPERPYRFPIDIPKARMWLSSEVATASINYIPYLKERAKKTSTVVKGEDDYQTQIDLTMGTFLKDIIYAKHPFGEFMIEEDIETEKLHNRDFEDYKDIEILWIIDPIDGTSNLIRKSPDYAISIALAINGIMALGVIILPEHQEVYTADIYSKKAYLYKKGIQQHQVKVSDVTSLSKSTLSLGLSGRKAMREITEPVVMKLINNGTISDMRSYGSPVVSGSRVANGVVDGYCCYAYPWDMAASSIILAAAGGKITQADGKPWELFSPNGILTNGKIHDELIDLINKPEINSPE